MIEKIGVVMNPIDSINYKKDSTLVMLLEAERRGFEIYYFEQEDLLLNDGKPYGDAKLINVFQDETRWFTVYDQKRIALSDLDVILMRVDPPFNAEYIYTTYILEHAEQLGVLVANRPRALRDSNEKLFATHFPQCSPPTLVTQSIVNLQTFWLTYRDIVCKPLDSMGGASVFRLQPHDVNAQVIFEVLTRNQTCYIMAQQFIPEIKAGDKRILMINGEPVPYLLNRVPQENDWRGNLAVGAKGKVQALSKRDRFICEEVGPHLKARGLFFVGLDVIGDYLTEINVTSPTGIREIDAGANINVSAMLWDVLESLKK